MKENRGLNGDELKTPCEETDASICCCGRWAWRVGVGPVPSAQVIQRLNWLLTGDLTHLRAVCCTEALVSSHMHLWWGCLSVLTTRQLASSRVTNPRDSKVEAAVLGLLGLTGERDHSEPLDSVGERPWRQHLPSPTVGCYLLDLGVQVSGWAPGPCGRFPFRSCIVLWKVGRLGTERNSEAVPPCPFSLAWEKSVLHHF